MRLCTFMCVHEVCESSLDQCNDGCLSVVLSHWLAVSFVFLDTGLTF